MEALERRCQALMQTDTRCLAIAKPRACAHDAMTKLKNAEHVARLESYENKHTRAHTHTLSKSRASRAYSKCMYVCGTSRIKQRL